MQHASRLVENAKEQRCVPASLGAGIELANAIAVRKDLSTPAIESAAGRPFPEASAMNRAKQLPESGMKP
jgi:hypothetical protein